MIRKLSVTVFALSLAVLGCGSDDGGTKKNDASPEAGRDTTPLAEVQQGPEVKSEVNTAEVPGVTAEVAKPSVDVGGEAGPAIDTGKLDTAALEGGSDISITPDAPAIDATPEIDVAAID
jgi:hypothetical protein